MASAERALHATMFAGPRPTFSPPRFLPAVIGSNVPYYATRLAFLLSWGSERAESRATYSAPSFVRSCEIARYNRRSHIVATDKTIHTVAVLGKPSRRFRSNNGPSKSPLVHLYVTRYGTSPLPAQDATRTTRGGLTRSSEVSRGFAISSSC